MCIYIGVCIYVYVYAYYIYRDIYILHIGRDSFSVHQACVYGYTHLHKHTHIHTYTNTHIQLLTLLQQLARRSKVAVAFTIHQPSNHVFEHFDKVIYTHVHAHVCAHMYVHKCECVYMCAHDCVNVYMCKIAVACTIHQPSNHVLEHF